MIINKLLAHVDDGSLPYSKMHITAPVEKFKMTMDMITEKTYRWLEMSEIVTDIQCSDIIDGVAHDVAVVFDTSDGGLELVDVK